MHLAVLDGIEVVYVQILNSPGSTRLPSRLGGRLPAHATGVGKVILAYSPAEVVTARIDAGLTRLTPRTICTPGTLSRELETIRANGVAYDREESTVGIHCVAAPVFDAQDRVVAAPVSYTHLDVYKRQGGDTPATPGAPHRRCRRRRARRGGRCAR